VKRRAFLTGVAGAAGGAAAAGGWDRYGPWRRPTVPEFGRLSFAQQGEDIVLWHALHQVLGLDHPTYMDIGAAHPVRASNTYLLYGTGSTGVLVEPNPMYVAMLRQQRPKDDVIAAGIGVTDEAEADYYEIKGNPLLNTFSKAQVDKLQDENGKDVVERVTKMPLVNINRAIAEHLGRAPDLLSTDVEGLDEAILRSLDLSRFRPGVICCESVPFARDGRETPITEYLMAQGYVLRGGSMVNSIFLDASRIPASA
jgi:FkbM family methyltransferase